MSGLGFNISSRADQAVLEVSGEVDMVTAPQLLEAILAIHRTFQQDVTVDLSGVVFMDSQGLSTLVFARRQLAGTRRRLRVDNARPGVAKLLDITGIEHYLNSDEEPLST